MSGTLSEPAFAAMLRSLPSADGKARAEAAERQTKLTKPAGALGRLEDLAIFLAGWSRDGMPRADRAHIALFAGNHGIAARGVSPYPAAVTAQMVANFRAGGAAINTLARANGCALSVHPLHLDRPTADISCAAAMASDETAEAIAAGIAAVPSDIDVLLIGEMGIANTTIAAALAAHVYGGRGEDWAGAGTGHDAAGVALKAHLVDAALARHCHIPRTTFDTLRALGGRELAAMAGAILEARRRRIPVLIDGFVVSAALATLTLEAPSIADHCIAAHVSGERAHRLLLDRLGLDPLLDLGMRLGEGSGAATALPLLRAACAAHVGMATFAEAAVATRDA
jgi:nicotinate-nucleotide--dimethylbenzimidazole phosphoribosyltransferase